MTRSVTGSAAPAAGVGAGGAVTVTAGVGTGAGPAAGAGADWSGRDESCRRDAGAADTATSAGGGATGRAGGAVTTAGIDAGTARYATDAVRWRRGTAGRGRAPLPRRRLRRARRRSVRDDAQRALHDLGLGAVDTADGVEPAAVDVGAIDPLGTAGDAARERQGDLGTEAGGEVDRVVDRVAAATAQVQRPELGILLAEVRDGRDDAVLEDLDRDHVLDADAHGVAGEPLGVRDDDLVSPPPRTPAAGRRPRRTRSRRGPA